MGHHTPRRPLWLVLLAAIALALAACGADGDGAANGDDEADQKPQH
jgi:hypothetical protein